MKAAFCIPATIKNGNAWNAGQIIRESAYSGNDGNFRKHVASHSPTEVKPKWFVFMAGEEDEYSVTRHASYSAAVWEAQCRGCTEKRPKRLHAGFYELNGCSGKTTYFIATAKAMERQGYGDLTVLR